MNENAPRGSFTTARILYPLAVAMLAGLVAAAVVAGRSLGIAGVGSAVAWSLALAAAGTVLGLLFGIPRVRAGKGPSTSGAADESPGFDHNTNLEEVSDWLTKILVGIGLVELDKVKALFSRLSRVVGDSVGPAGNSAISLGAAIVLLFSTTGFMVGYLVARGYLPDVFSQLANRLVKKVARLEQVADTALKQSLSDARLEADARGRPLYPNERVQEEYRSDEITYEELWESDPCKGFSAGNGNEANGRRLSAVIRSRKGANPFVVITVESTDPGNRPLNSPVLVLLHPTYPKCTRTLTPSNNRVQTEIRPDSGFTVGAVCDGGATKLELDLMKIRGGPKSFYV